MKQYNIDRAENGRKVRQNFPAVNCFFQEVCQSEILDKTKRLVVYCAYKEKNIFSLENTVSQVKKEEKV